MSKVNYRWWSHDLNCGGIYETAEAVGSHPQVLATFGEARTALGDHFHALEVIAGAARYRARNVRKSDVKDGEWSV